ncbi:hypothetical protein Tco_1163746, partial [Tanacetum coccineum]
VPGTFQGVRTSEEESSGLSTRERELYDLESTASSNAWWEKTIQDDHRLKWLPTTRVGYLSPSKHKYSSKRSYDEPLLINGKQRWWKLEMNEEQMDVLLRHRQACNRPKELMEKVPSDLKVCDKRKGGDMSLVMGWRILEKTTRRQGRGTGKYAVGKECGKLIGYSVDCKTRTRKRRRPEVHLGFVLELVMNEKCMPVSPSAMQESALDDNEYTVRGGELVLWTVIGFHIENGYEKPVVMTEAHKYSMAIQEAVTDQNNDLQDM